jgi:hypothetical protein
MPGIDYTIGAKLSGFHAGIKGALSGIAGLAGSVARIASPVAAIAGVGSLGLALGKAVSKAAEMESLQTAFQPLLGSAAAARERIAELSRFAAETPFEMPEIATASRVLETLTRGALATGEGLRLVGDVAAATGAPFNEIATTIGRLYDGLDSGRPVGEAMARLQELGVISGDTRGRLEALQAEGVKGAGAWAVAAAAMGRFSGGMALQSQTWSGKLSTLKDNIGLAFAAFGTPIIDAVKPFLDSTIRATSTLTVKAAEFGKIVADTIALMGAAFQTDIPGLAEAGLKTAILNSVNDLWRRLRAAIAAVGQAILENIRTGLTYLEILTTADFWKGMGNAIAGVFTGAIAVLQGGLAEAIELARPLAEILGAEGMLDSELATLRAGRDKHSKMSQDSFASAGAAFGADPAKLIETRFAQGQKNIIARYNEAVAGTSDLVDASGASADLDAAFAAVRQKAADNAARAAKAKADLEAALRKTWVPEFVGPPRPPKADAGPWTPEFVGPPRPTDVDWPAAAAARQVQADRLRQIGGYVGRGMDAAKDRLAERTEQWTRKSAEGIEKLVAALKPGKPEPAAGLFV